MIFGLRQKEDKRSDEELLTAYKKRPSPSVLTTLFHRHSHKLFGLCLSYLKNDQDAEDVVMETFESLHDKIMAYEIDNFESWLFFVTRNYCLKVLKRKARKRTEGLDEITEENFVESPPEKALSIEERRMEVLSDAIDQLNPPQRRCIILFYLENRSYQQVSELAGFELNEVKSHIQNGKRNLRNLINKLA